MFNNAENADSISRWEALGIKPTAELAEALAIFDNARYVEVGHRPRFDLESLTIDNADEMIRAHAAQLAMTTGTGEGGSGLSVLESAKSEAVDLAARQVVSIARAAIPHAIEQLSKPFGKAAAQYCGSVAKLPEIVTSDSLIAAGASVVEAYGEALQAATYLNSVSDWVASTGAMSGFLPRDMEVTLRILRPDTIDQLLGLDDAHRSQANPALVAIDPVLYAAARLGVPFGINTLTEAQQLRSELSTVRPQALVNQ